VARAARKIFQDVGVIAPLRRLFSLQEDVSMGINQPGQHCGVRKIDCAGAGWNLRGSGVRDALDAIAVNHDNLIAARLVGRAVNQPASPDDGDALRRWGLGIDEWNERERNDQAEQVAHVHLFASGGHITSWR